MLSAPESAAEAEYRRAMLAHSVAGKANDLVTLEAERRVIRALLPRVGLQAIRRVERDCAAGVWIPVLAEGRPWRLYDSAGNEIPDRPGCVECVVLVEDGPALFAYAAEAAPPPNRGFVCVGRRLTARESSELETRLARLDQPDGLQVVVTVAFDGSPRGNGMAEAFVERCQGRRFVERVRPAHGQEWFGQYGGRGGPELGR